jgi:hypothetical protein
MKRTIFIALALLVTSIGVAAQDYGLPELHTIKTVTLSPSYSCRPVDEFQKGYQNTALFLSNYSKRRNSPDLLFNGACRSDDEFGASTAGDDMAFIVDLGDELQLEKLSAQDILQLYHMRSSPNSPFTKHSPSVLRQDAKVLLGHTYAVFLNKREIRGLFAFTVVSHVPNQSVEIKYAVKEYQITGVRAESPGFSWGQENTTAQTDSSAGKEQSRKQN